jgi:hypothetical protein
MAGPVAAKPKSFMLKMRLTQPDGTPFAERSYRVKWGNKLIPAEALPPRKTDKDGALGMLLDAGPAGAPQGELLVVERDRVSAKETVVWKIPLRIVDDPPAAALPAIETMPVPPAEGSSDEVVTEYEKELARYEMRVLVPIREHMVEFLQQWDAVRNVVTTLPLPPSPTATDSELWAAWVLLCQAYALVQAGYEASWRLWNLAHLPVDKEPSFPIFGSDVPHLQRALSRFARIRGVTTGFPMVAVPDELKNVQAVHDKRGPMRP